MSWLRRIATKVDFNHTITILTQYIKKFPGDWKLSGVNRIDEEEQHLTYTGRHVKKPFDKYRIGVWFMYDPTNIPEQYHKEIGHHTIRFGCLVIDPETSEAIGFAREELDTPKEVADFAWKTIENHGWDNTEGDEDEPITPILPETSVPSTSVPSVSDPKLSPSLVGV